MLLGPGECPGRRASGERLGGDADRLYQQTGPAVCEWQTLSVVCCSEYFVNCERCVKFALARDAIKYTYKPEIQSGLNA